jgi:TorA maturation chaperone TorD
MIDQWQIQDVAAGRASTYGVLSALYLAAPSEALVDSIRTGDVIADGGSGALHAAANDMMVAFGEAAAKSGFGNELAAEHTRLFVLPSGVVPHESFYVDTNKRLGGRVTEGVKRYYRDASAELTEQCLDLPDHIGVELQFMSFLCDIEAQLRGQPDAAGLRKCLGCQSEFLNEHLLRWYKPCCQKVISEASSGVYRAVARLTMAYLDAERKLVPQLISEIDSESRTVCGPETT